MNHHVAKQTMKRTPVYRASIPHFSKIHFTPLCFYERPTLVLLSLTRTDPKSTFTFMKRQQVKTAFSVCFAGSRCRGGVHPEQRDGHCQAPVLGAPLSISSCSALTCLWASVRHPDLHCASASQRSPKAIAFFTLCHFGSPKVLQEHSPFIRKHSTFTRNQGKSVLQLKQGSRVAPRSPSASLIYCQLTSDVNTSFTNPEVYTTLLTATRYQLGCPAWSHFCKTYKKITWRNMVKQ